MAERRGWQSAGQWRMRAAGETWRRLMVSVTPTGFPIRDGSVYRGSATAPPPACNPSLLRSFHFAMARRVTGGALPLHRLPVIHRSYGASISRWHAGLQGLRYRSTTCLWSCHPSGVPPARRENECQLNERAIANSTRGRRSIPASPERAADHRQGWSPQGRNPCTIGTPNQTSPDGATEYRQGRNP